MRLTKPGAPHPISGRKTRQTLSAVVEGMEAARDTLSGLVQDSGVVKQRMAALEDAQHVETRNRELDQLALRERIAALEDVMRGGILRRLAWLLLGVE